MPRRQNSYVDFAGSSHNLAAGLSLPPPVVPDAMAPLQLDFERARELESEEPLSLPRPWSYSGRDSAGASRRAAAAAADLASEELARTRSRSPDRVYNRLSVSHASSRQHADHLQQKLAQVAVSKISTSPPSSKEMPNTRFVEGLVGAACIAVDVVWKSGEEQQTGYIIVNGLPTPRASPTSGVSPHDALSTSSSSSDRSVLPLRHFIKEVLRRSRSTCSTLQTALYYIHKSRDAIRQRVKDADEARAELLRLRSSTGEISWHALSSSSSGTPGAEHIQLAPRTAAALLAKTRDPVLCGRRMFLAALICASKFLQDRTYSNRAWSKISSLPVQEINANEKAFLELMDYNLYVDADLFKNCERFSAHHVSAPHSCSLSDAPSFLPKGPAVFKISPRSTIGKRTLRLQHCSSLTTRCPSQRSMLSCETVWVGVKATIRLHRNSRTLHALDLCCQQAVAAMACPTLHLHPLPVLGTTSRPRQRTAGPVSVLQHGAVSVALEGYPTACREAILKGFWSTWLPADSLH